MSNRRDSDFLLDIQEAITRILEYTDALSYDDFLHDHKTQDAVARNLEVIGEATKNLSETLRHAYPQTQWRGLAGLRDKLIHHYFGINWHIVWTIIEDQLSDLLKQIEEILENEKWNDNE